ncbi:sensor histidine kinase [Candidatus Solincola sp.]|nr:HAMP domain-containing sensor histidine kinase [Actinomycetota bacterium]MDI7251595.1 HAMP domain-containing sensor histidine kinase [Actinomycetota bacterium]
MGFHRRSKPLFRSLRARFLFHFLLLTALSLLIFGSLFAYFIWRENRRLLERARSELVEQAREMANDLQLALSLSRRYPEAPLLNLERLAQLLRLEGKLINALSLVVDREGSVVAPRLLAPRVPRRLDTNLLAEDEVRAQETELPQLGKVMVVSLPLAQPGLEGREEYFNLVVIKSTGELVTSPASTLTRYLALAGGVALAVSVLLALYLSNYVSRPLHRLSLAAWDLAHGNLERRVDVSGGDEIARLAEYFNYMAERVALSARLQKEFVANVSHEIRTPLTSIEGFSQALLDGVVESEEDRRRYLEIIVRESSRLKRVLSQLLALSRIDTGAWALHPSPLSPRAFLEGLAEKLRPRAEEKGLEFSLELAEGLPELETDADALEQVLTNLVDNAVKFTPPGGKVTLSADLMPAGDLRIQVRDTGNGIPPEDLERVFDRFFRVDRSRSQDHGGSGLGLALCRELVTLLGGEITAWSEPGRGSVFTVDLPERPPRGR